MSETRPEQAATVTPGQAAYWPRMFRDRAGDVWIEFDGELMIPLKELIATQEDRSAVMTSTAIVAELGPVEVAGYGSISRELPSATARKLSDERDKLADEQQKAEATIADYRDALCAMQAERDSLTGRVAELVTEGNELRKLLGEIKTVVIRSGTHQSKIRRVLELLGVFDSQHAPAVVTAGTEHPTEQIRDLAIRDKEGQP